ncbi:uncharacterized protein PHACADRAFT_183635 [Phanerochaete carnosa HHB-10118-sp]|uniref:Uncharacterized protein n=1 Tax=Phanerochaete carnosa (strain HHB-10118-sp) TaxID=650164 RepID=K5X2S1_PHACS|nr:uncharacterized protein PHACADRAFT_183635 [Phanerochaete carnosa HHB-10118-sp]EKM57107.1 hypothetical protein PHACADRAFT_183635 [Phanerochaete carnosa HHB-10118-sp]
MPSSTVSLEPLSSPSPSPSPPPPETRTSTSNNSGAGAGLDSDSELSELTEDEQENVNTDRTEQLHPTKRRKRGGIVPAPMWDWAYKNKKEWKNTMVEEEEEEEQSGPAKALEEEEEDDRASRSRSTTTPLPERRRKRSNGGGLAVVRSDDEQDRDRDKEDDAASADEASAPPALDDTGNDLDYNSEDDESHFVPRADAARSREPIGGAASAEATDDEPMEEDDDPAAGDNAVDDDPTNEDGCAASDSEAAQKSATSTAPSSGAPLPTSTSLVAVDRDVDPGATLMDVDKTAPVPEKVSPIVAAAAASSIMAGAEVVDPPSPSPSTSTASGSGHNRSRSPSRSPSPDNVSDNETSIKRGAPKTRGKLRSGRATRNRSRRKAKGEPDLDLETDPIPAEADIEEADVDEGDLDSPEIDMELELQPAHRAEALDYLATIEFKYAMLREKVYVEKMEALAWEEALVHQGKGIHPEMLHLHAELDQRKDTRLELARKRRTHEAANVTKRRKLEETGVWSWWQFRRDELQTEMIAETHRKRRQLDRERRALERPQPIRCIPSPPREIAAPPTLRDLVKASPFDSSESRRHAGSASLLAYPQLSTLAPGEIAGDIEFLLNHRRNAGLVMNHPVFPHPVPGPPAFDHYNVGPGVLDGPGAPNRYPPHMPFQQPPMLPPAMPPQMVQAYPGVAPPPRLQHHHSAPSGSIPIAHPQMLIEQEFASAHRPVSGSAHQSTQMQQYPAGGPLSRNRRSLSPVPLHPVGNGSTVMGAGPSSISTKGSGRSAIPGPGPSGLGLSEAKRIDVAGYAMDQDMILMDRERERQRMMELEKQKERDYRDRRERERAMEIEQERREHRQREQEREQLDLERAMERSNHVPHAVQRHASHQHLIHPSQGGHMHSAHHHHHHHHHVVHHHSGSSNGLGSSTSGQHQGSLPPLPGPASNGVASAANSPHMSIRDPEAQRQHAGMPVEVIDLHPSVQSTVSSRSLSRKGNDEQLAPQADAVRERTRPPLPHERSAPPFVTPPTQSSGGNYPPSPQASQGFSTAPASVAPSRRGSWSTSDGTAVPRPSSSASAHLPPLPVSQRLPVSSLPNRIPPAQLSPTAQPHRSPLLLSPPRNGIIRLPLSPPQSSSVRSPTRNSQPLPGPSLPGPASSGTVTKPVSPKNTRRTPPLPPPLTTRPKSPLTRERSMSSTVPPSIPLGQKHLRMSPVSIFPAPVSQPTPLPSSRLPNVGTDSDANLVSAPPKVNAVPVD